MNGLGLALCAAMYSSMAASKSGTLLNTPGRICLSVMSRKNRSTMLSQDELVGPMEEEELGEPAPAPAATTLTKESPRASAPEAPKETKPSAPTEDKKKYVKSYGSF